MGQVLTTRGEGRSQRLELRANLGTCLSHMSTILSLPDTKSLTYVRTFAEIQTMIQAGHGASLNSQRLDTRIVGCLSVQMWSV